jgi:hypothetical protein
MSPVKAQHQIKITATNQEDGYRIFSLLVSSGNTRKDYKIYAFDRDIPLKDDELSSVNLEKFAVEQMEEWLKDSGGILPKDKFRVLVNGGKITTDNVESFLSVQKKSSDLIRTNVTISATLFEWAKSKAQKEDTSFSDLVSRGLITLKDSDKEIDAWFKEQGAYFRKKLGEFGSFEVFHYLPNNYTEFSTESLKNALENAVLRRTGWPIGVYLTGGENKPYPQEDGIKAEYAGKSDPSRDYWYAKNKGEFYFLRKLESDSGHGEAMPGTALYFDTLVWRVAESLEHCLAYYKNLDIDESERVKLRISLNGLNSRKLSAWNPARAFTLHHYVSGTDKSSWEVEMPLSELSSELDEIIYEAIKKLLVMFDFFVPNKEVVLDILNREYRKSNF